MTLLMLAVTHRRPRADCPAVRTGGRHGPPGNRSSDRFDDLVEVEAWQTVEPRVLAGLAHVHHNEGLPRLVTEELRVDPRCVESGHRTGGEPRRANTDDEVSDLK